MGVTTNDTININGEHLGSGNGVPLDAFLAQDAAHVEELVRTSVLPFVLGGTRTTSLLVIDIEAPARPDALWSFNSTLLRRVVSALQLRVTVLRRVFPRAAISMYGAPTRLRISQADAGYQRASALGLFDDVDYTTPSLYLSPGQDAANVTRQVLHVARSIRKSNGTEVPLAPFLSWVFEGPKTGSDWHCALSVDTM